MTAVLRDEAFYVNYGNGSSTGHFAITAWATGQSKTVGQTVRATAPSVYNERVFVCIVAGTTHASTQPTWVLTRGAKTTDNTVTWMEASGQPALNGDSTNTTTWALVKAGSTDAVLGQVIKNSGNTHYFICTTAGAMGASEPGSWNTTTGATTTDNSAVWTCLGAFAAFSAWANPHARVYNAIQSGWAQYYSKLFVSQNSAETQSSTTTYTFPGTNAKPLEVFCIDDGAALPPTHSSMTTGAQLKTTGSTNILFSGGAAIYGFSITSGTSGASNITIASGTSSYIFLKNCALKRGSSTTSSILIGSANAAARLENTTVELANASDTVLCQGVVEWYNTPSLVQGATIPTSLFRGFTGKAIIDGCDLSALGSGKNITTAVASQSGILVIRNCKLDASVTLADVTNQEAKMYAANFINCSSGAVNNMFARYNNGGALTSETTVIRTGGEATSWKCAISGNNSYDAPFESFDLVAWNNVTSGNVTLTIYGITDAGSRPYDWQIWVEAFYMGATDSPISTFVSNGMVDSLSTSSQHATDSSTWGGSTTKFKMTLTLAPRIAGPIYAKIRFGDYSAQTYYIDPKIYLS